MLKKTMQAMILGRRAGEGRLIIGVFLRMIIIVILALSGLLLFIVNRVLEEVPQETFGRFAFQFTTFSALYFASNGLYLRMLRRGANSRVFQYYLGVQDAFALTWFLVYWIGSCHSIMILTYPSLVFFNRTFLDRKLSRASIVFIMFFYVLIRILEITQVLPYGPMFGRPNPFSLPMSVYIVVFLLFWLVMTYVFADIFVMMAERIEDQLLQREGLASVGQLVATIVHDLNNPLASAKSLVDSAGDALRERGVEEDEELAEVAEDLDFVERELGRAQEIVRSLLGLSRSTEATDEEVDANQLVRSVERIGRVQIKKNLGGAIAIDLDLADPPPTARGNFAKFGQVLLNLLTNALQAVDPQTGRIVLKTSRGPHGEAIIECRDNGRGMDKETLKCAFNPFFTTKKEGEGTGLGLHMCDEVLRRLGGSISLESEAGKGACATIVLPGAERAAEGEPQQGIE